jgi:hypothetical protein
MEELKGLLYAFEAASILMASEFDRAWQLCFHYVLVVVGERGMR